MNTFYKHVSLGLRMALQPHQRSAIPQSRARGSPLTPAGHRSSGSDDYPSTEEGRGTPHEPTEGLDPSSYWSDHSNPHDTFPTFLFYTSKRETPGESRENTNQSALRYVCLVLALRWARPPAHAGHSFHLRPPTRRHSLPIAAPLRPCTARDVVARDCVSSSQRGERGEP